ncbi:MAG: AraC family transcriptional regulator ligand-binding domain-containing protein, partial [Myxococcales bacterium]|nr:AraC family transcriptional regulator ligand-binding domain-containing protein [Myxococcales bacterium]
MGEDDIPAENTVAAAVTARLIEHATRHGVPLPDLFEQAAWPSFTSHPDFRVPFATHWAVWEAVHEHGVPGDFGLRFGDSFELDQLGVLGMLMTHSATVEEALAQQTRFQRLLLDTPFKVTRLEPGKLVIEHPRLPVAMRLPHMIVAGLAYWMKLLRALLCEEVGALNVELPHPPLTNVDDYRAVFGTSPRFDAPRILLEIDRDLWSAPVRAASLGIEAYLRERATRILQSLATGGDALEGIREYMADELRHGRHPTLAAAAKRLGTSTRTLQRSLQSAQQSYDTLLDQTRKQLSLEYRGDDR